MSTFLTTKEAAFRANKTQETIRQWIQDFGIGIKVGGRWSISESMLNRVLSGEVHYKRKPEIPIQNENELTIIQAATLANKSTMTIRNWIQDFGIGKKIGGRYLIYKNKLEQILSGELFYENQGRPKKEN